MNHARTLRYFTLVAVAIATAGCGVDDPYASTTPTTATTAPTAATTAPAPAQVPTDQDEPNPVDTVTGATTIVPTEVSRRDERVRVAVDFAVTQATWTPDTWIPQQKRLGTLATGAAKAELNPTDLPLEDQAQALRDAKATSRATFLAADVSEGRDDPSEATVIVVLKVVAGGAGRQESNPDYTVNQAKVQRTSAGWRVRNYSTLP